MDKKNKLIKVNCNLRLGNYYVGTGEKSAVKPITGRDYTKFFKRNFSRRLLSKRSKEIRQRYDLPKRVVKNVDTVLYKTLEEYDFYNNTNYKINYLNVYAKEIIRQKGESKREYNKRCRDIRSKALLDAGLDITYEVDLLRANSDISLIDRIKIWRLARKQSKYIGANYYFGNSDKYLDSDITVDDDRIDPAYEIVFQNGEMKEAELENQEKLQTDLNKQDEEQRRRESIRKSVSEQMSELDRRIQSSMTKGSKVDEVDKIVQEQLKQTSEEIKRIMKKTDSNESEIMRVFHENIGTLEENITGILASRRVARGTEELEVPDFLKKDNKAVGSENPKKEETAVPPSSESKSSTENTGKRPELVKIRRPVVREETFEIPDFLKRANSKIATKNPVEQKNTQSEVRKSEEPKREIEIPDFIKNGGSSIINGLGVKTRENSAKTKGIDNPIKTEVGSRTTENAKVERNNSSRKIEPRLPLKDSRFKKVKRFIRTLRSPSDSIRNKVYKRNRVFKKITISAAVGVVLLAISLGAVSYINSHKKIDPSQKVTILETDNDSSRDESIEGLAGLNTYKESDFEAVSTEHIDIENDFSDVMPINDVASFVNERASELESEYVSETETEKSTEVEETEKAKAEKENYLSSVKVGATMNIEKGRFFETPEGTGNYGRFENFQGTSKVISKIGIATKNGYIEINDSSVSLYELKQKYPDGKFSYHFVDSEGHVLGWLTGDSLNQTLEQNNQEIDDSER